MAGTRISVSIKGALGLDDPVRMLSDLEAATGLSWHREPVAKKEALGHYADLLLGAVLGQAAQMTVDRALHTVEQVLERWRRERLDPPEMSVDVEPAPDTDAGGSADPAG